MWPVFLFFAPETAQAILQYRVNRMTGAQDNALRNNFDGLMYPWESAFSGTEAYLVLLKKKSPVLLFSLLVGYR
jgi:trehalose/maltose hydrolase-like predicted phosphorylase